MKSYHNIKSVIIILEYKPDDVTNMMILYLSIVTISTICIDVIKDSQYNGMIYNKASNLTPKLLCSKRKALGSKYTSPGCYITTIHRFKLEK